MSIQVKNAKNITLDGQSVKQIKDSNGNVLWTKTQPEPYSGLKLTATQDGSTVGYTITGTLPDIHIQTSINGSTWTDWDGTAITLNNGQYRYIRNTTNTLSDAFNNFSFVMSGKISATGDISSLINYKSLSLPDYCFYKLFYNCASLIHAPELPSTALSSSCYKLMFAHCTSLITTPKLPAEYLFDSSYQQMFLGCSSLTKISKIGGDYFSPATSSNCYQSMFEDCTSLKVNQNGTGTKIITAGQPGTNIYTDMFTNTAGTFTGTPTQGNTYYWYE